MNSEVLTEARDPPEILMRETEAQKAWGSELVEGNTNILPTQLRSLLHREDQSSAGPECPAVIPA